MSTPTRAFGPPAVNLPPITAGDVFVEDMTDEEDVFLLEPSTMKEGYTYRWVQNRPDNINRKRLKGYEIVKRSDGEKPLFDSEEGAAADIIKRGDVVLMRVRGTRHQKNREKIEGIGRLRLNQGEERFKAEAAKRRLPSGDTPLVVDDNFKSGKEPEDEE